MSTDNRQQAAQNKRVLRLYLRLKTFMLEWAKAMIDVRNIQLTIDESERRFGNSKLIVDLSVVDQTPFFDREEDPIDRYGYKVKIFGFGRDGSPPRGSALERLSFQRISLGGRLICNFRQTPLCSFQPETTLTEIFRFDPERTEMPNDSESILRGRAEMNVGLDVLDVDPSIAFTFFGREILVPKADCVFARVSIVDLSSGEETIQVSDSDTICDFFGTNESRLRAGVGSNRERP